MSTRGLQGGWPADAAREVMLHQSYDDLKAACLVDRQAIAICEDNSFWAAKLAVDFGGALRAASRGGRERYLEYLHNYGDPYSNTYPFVNEESPQIVGYFQATLRAFVRGNVYLASQFIKSLGPVTQKLATILQTVAAYSGNEDIIDLVDYKRQSHLIANILGITGKVNSYISYGLYINPPSLSDTVKAAAYNGATKSVEKMMDLAVGTIRSTLSDSILQGYARAGTDAEAFGRLWDRLLPYGPSGAALTSGPYSDALGAGGNATILAKYINAVKYKHEVILGALCAEVAHSLVSYGWRANIKERVAAFRLALSHVNIRTLTNSEYLSRLILDASIVVPLVEELLKFMPNLTAEDIVVIFSNSKNNLLNFNNLAVLRYIIEHFNSRRNEILDIVLAAHPEYIREKGLRKLPGPEEPTWLVGGPLPGPESAT